VSLGLAEADDVDKRAYLLPRIVEAANRAAEPNPRSISAHLSLFFAYWSTCQPERMRVEADTILPINPNDATSLFPIGYGLIVAEDAEYGRQLADRAIALVGAGSPRDWGGALGDYHYAKGEYAEAAEDFRKTFSETSWIEHMRVMVGPLRE
jgi:adenylate cyclase